MQIIIFLFNGKCTETILTSVWKGTVSWEMGFVACVAYVENEGFDQPAHSGVRSWDIRGICGQRRLPSACAFRDQVMRHLRQSRATKAQISLRIRAAWSEHSLPAYKAIDYSRLYGRTRKTQHVRGAGWTVTSLFPYNMGHFLTLLITKTRLFKYIENFTTKKGKFSDKKKSDISHIFCSKHRLWVLVRSALPRRF